MQDQVLRELFSELNELAIAIQQTPEALKRQEKTPDAPKHKGEALIIMQGRSPSEQMDLIDAVVNAEDQS